jgi:hypothetical protein
MIYECARWAMDRFVNAQMGMIEELVVAVVDWDIVVSRIRLLLSFEDVEGH